MKIPAQDERGAHGPAVHRAAVHNPLRRAIRLARVAAWALLPVLVALPAAAQTLEETIAAAKKEGAILWYDSLPREQGERILKEFQKDYPFVSRLEYLEVPGAQKTARVTQELRAGGPTADVLIDTPSGIQNYIDAGFAVKIDWKGLQVPVSAVHTPNDYIVAVTTPSYGLLYNTTKVSDAEVPGSWETLLDPKWKKRIGTWARVNGFVNFVPLWGEDKARAYIRQFAELQPRLFRSTYTAAQAVGSGEIDIAFTIYHTALPTIEKGAPVKWVYLDPTPVALLYGVILKYGKNPSSAKLLLKWLGSKNGALAYEAVAQRGNHLVPETRTAQMLKGKTLAYPNAQDEIKNAALYNRLEAEYGKILAGR